MKRILAFSLTLLTAALSFISCKETEAYDDKADWENRNIAFMENVVSQYAASPANVATAQEGQIFRLLSYKLDPSKDWDPLTSYVYCKVIERSENTGSPCFSDSVKINYRVRLMPTDDYPQGQVIDQSYRTDKLDPEVNIPYPFCISGLIEGVSTALMYMHTGDTWLLYIPYQLGYGTSAKSDIPAYSTLLFEVNLARFARTGASL